MNSENLIVKLRSLNTPPEVLDCLSNDKSWRVRRGVAQNPNTTPEILTRLADDEEWLVRDDVARNPNTPPETLERLANDEDAWVRCNVAGNPSTPSKILDCLADDEDAWGIVRHIVLGNQNIPQYLKEYLNAIEFMERCYESRWIINL